ncbi:MAG TPA: hypothetical protein VIA06_00945, partial [Candidatus Dormibacteraeota bacterium]|nr:hypothetical protein [Candidatus Dormibacteraeota bacterium]
GSYGTLDMEPITAGNEGHSMLPVVVSGNTMVTRNLPKNANASRTPDDLVAFDLTSGKELWSKNLVNVSQSIPIAIQNGNVIAIVTGVYEAPPQVFQVSLRNGAAKALGPPYSRALIETPNFSQLYWQGGHVYGAALTNIGKGFLLYDLN